jgi:hypothetical protein
VKASPATIHNDDYRRLIRQITELRKHAGISQKGIAVHIGLDQPDVSKIENFERRLDALELLLWIKAVSPERHTAIVNMIQSPCNPGINCFKNEL